MSALLELLAERRSGKISIRDPALAEYLGWMNDDADSGERITPDRAMTIGAVFGAIRIRAEALSVLPLKVYRTDADGARREARESPAWKLLHDRPNPLMTPATFKKALQAHMDSRGNARAEIVSDKAGRPVELWPLDPAHTKVSKLVKPGEEVLRYETRRTTDEQGRGVRVLFSDEVLDIPGLGFDGVHGHSILGHYARATLGVALGMKKFRSQFLKSGAWFSGGLKHPGKLDAKARKTLREDLQKLHGGAPNAFKPMVLWDNMEWFQVSLPKEDAMMLGLEQFTVRDVARFYRIPLHMLADMEKGASFASVVEVGQEFVRYTLADPIRAWQEECTHKLGRPGEFCEFVTEAFLAGDTKARYESYKIAREGGWMSLNEIRARENLPPIPGGDNYLVPKNMGVIGPDADQFPDEDDPPARGLPPSHRALLIDAFEPIVTKEIDRVQRHADKAPADFLAWAERFYRAHREQLVDQLTARVTVVAEALGVEADRAHRALARFADDEIARARDTAVRTLEDATLETTLAGWKCHRPERMADDLLKEIQA